jgi:hypothetical protein
MAFGAGNFSLPAPLARKSSKWAAREAALAIIWRTFDRRQRTRDLTSSPWKERRTVREQKGN